MEAAHNRVIEGAKNSEQLEMRYSENFPQRLEVVNSSTVPTSLALFEEGIDRSSITTNELNNAHNIVTVDTNNHDISADYQIDQNMFQRTSQLSEFDYNLNPN